jgi:hypothetical protein
MKTTNEQRGGTREVVNLEPLPHAVTVSGEYMLALLDDADALEAAEREIAKLRDENKRLRSGGSSRFNKYGEAY